jgi:SNF2 family DNA or RNA helicase
VDKVFPYKIGALFMDMGTGKTRCAIELIFRRQQRVSKVIWFCPVSLKLTIAEELTKHTAGEDVFVFDDVVTDQSIPPAFVYIVGIESMSSSDRVVLAVNKLVDEDTFAIVDESSYIKGHASRRSMRITEICRRARYRLLLTGTPITQGVVDLYAQLKFLSPEILGYNSFYSFARNHLEYSEKYTGMIVRSKNVDNLAWKIAPFVYQVTKAECMDLPEKLYDQVYCSLSTEQAEAYEQAKHEILLDIDDDHLTSIVIFRLFTALQQIVSGFYHREDELLEFPHHRLDTLKTVLADIPENEKVIIWCKFVHSLRQIADTFPESALYYGDLDEHKRAAELERFRGADCRFLIATTATGGHGLTINEAHYHVFYENEFKYSHRIQAEDRSHRIGQTMPVTYIDVVSKSGIERRIMRALAKKEDVVKSFRKEVHHVRDIQI